MKRKIICALFLLISVFIFVVCYFYCLEKNTVAVIGAMDAEISEISNNLTYTKTLKHDDFNIINGKLGKYNIILSKSGVGKVNSASTTQFIIDKYKPKYIINIGIAGSLTDDLHLGDIIIAKKAIQHDFDLTAFGNPKGYMDTGVEPDKPTIFYSDENLTDKFNHILKSKENRVFEGTIATGDIFVDDISQKSSIHDIFKADAIDMESASILQTAQRNNIPAIIIRIISDEKENSTNEYAKNKANIAQKLALDIISVFKAEK